MPGCTQLKHRYLCGAELRAFFVKMCVSSRSPARCTIGLHRAGQDFSGRSDRGWSYRPDTSIWMS